MQNPLLLLKFVALHYVFIALVGFVSYLLGLRLTKRLKYDSLLEKISVCTSLGLGTIGYLIFLLGILAILYRWVVVLVLAACVVATYPIPIQVFKEMVSAARNATFRAGAFLKGIVLIAGGLALSAPLLVLPLYPPIQFDATFFFLASAKIYVQKHAVIFLPFHRPPVITQLNEMMFTLALLFYDDIAAQLIQLLMLTLLTLAVMAFCRRNFSNQAGWWSAALLLASPAMLWCGTVAYLDISLTLFSTMAAYTFWNWLQSREGTWLLLSGAFCGFAASTKYPGLFFPLFFFLVTVVIAIRERKYSIPLRLAAAGFIAGGPWYIRNFYYTRNPVFPFFPQLFGYSWWTAADVEGLVSDLRLHGVGRSFSALLTLPWSLTFNQDVFFSEGHHISTIFFFALPIVIVFVIKEARFRKLMGFFLAFMMFWAFSSQILRYLLPAIPVLSVASAASFDRLLGWIPFARKWRSHWIIVAMISVALIFGGWTYSFGTWEKSGPLPLTAEQRDNYFASRLPSYPAYKLLNSLGRNYTLYSMQDENMAYFVDGAYKGDYFGPARYSRLWDKFVDGQALYNELKSMDADYFLVNDSRMKIELPKDEFFRSHFKSLYHTNNVHLFELSNVPVQGTIVNMIQNPSFEELKEERPTGWLMAGKPSVDRSGAQGFNSRIAVRSNQAGDVVYQTLSVTPGEVYPFSCQARASALSRTAKLQAYWFDSGGKVLKEDIKLFEVGSAWKSCEMNVVAPTHSVRVTIYASVLDPGAVWFDDFSFGAIRYVPKVESSYVK